MAHCQSKSFIAKSEIFTGKNLIFLALLWLMGLYLRIPVLVAPPLASVIGDDLQLGQIGVGALTTIPVLVFALGALPSAWLNNRIGVKNTLLLGIIIMVLGSAARGLAPSALSIFLFTFLMGLGIAAMQTSLPSMVKSWLPSKVALGSAVYMNGMVCGEFSGAGLTLPLVYPLSGFDWRMTLFIWSVPALVITFCLFIIKGKDTPEKTASIAWLPDWKSGQVWQLGLLLAGSIVVFFSINAYMGSVLNARGEAKHLSTLLLIYNVSPIIASLLLVLIGEKVSGKKTAVFLCALLSMLGLLGFMILPGWLGMAFAVIAGFSATIELILLVSIPPMVATGIAISRLTSGMFTIGYGVAFVLPLLGGAIADMANDTFYVFLPPLLFSFFCLFIIKKAAI